ncbi:30S ribosomal protein S16 [Bacteroidota bacterium]
MAVKLRLRKMGKKKQPIYKIVAADARSPRDGRFLEAIGLYNPLTDPHTVDIKEDRVLYWLSNGAQPTQTVKSLLRQKGITLKNELIKRGVEEDKIESELSEWKKDKEARAEAKAKKKKVSRKAKAKQEAPEESSETENVVASEENQAKEENIDESAAEVKGATSDENEQAKE